YLEQELLEVSAVGIPANPNALVLGLKSGAIEKSDLQELLAMLKSLCAPGRVDSPLPTAEPGRVDSPLPTAEPGRVDSPLPTAAGRGLSALPYPAAGRGLSALPPILS